MNFKRNLAFIVATLALSGPAFLHAADTERQREVTMRGAEVMPFDQEQTMHRFQPLADGGLQRVTVKDPKNQAQIALIRSHLKEEARRFQHGDFGDPAKIHGVDMPGLAELSRGSTWLMPTELMAPKFATPPRIPRWSMRSTAGSRRSFMITGATQPCICRNNPAAIVATEV